MYFYTPDKKICSSHKGLFLKEYRFPFPSQKRNPCSGSHFEGHLHSEEHKNCAMYIDFMETFKKGCEHLLNSNLHILNSRLRGLDTSLSLPEFSEFRLKLSKKVFLIERF